MRSISTRIFPILCLMICSMVLSSCSNILGKRQYTLLITSSPEQADIVVRDKHGKLVYDGETPARILVRASTRFSKQKYAITMSKVGYETQTKVYTSCHDKNYTSDFILACAFDVDGIGVRDKLPQREDYFNMCLMPMH